MSLFKRRWLSPIASRDLVTRFDNSLPDAEAREDAVEQVIGVDRAGHLAERIDRAAERECEQLRRIVIRGKCVRFAQVIEAREDVVAAPPAA